MGVTSRQPGLRLGITTGGKAMGTETMKSGSMLGDNGLSRISGVSRVPTATCGITNISGIKIAPGVTPISNQTQDRVVRAPVR